MRALAVALLLTGCGSGGAPQCQDADLQGTWQGTPVQGNFARISMVFASGGAYTVYLNETAFHGHYSFDPSTSQLTILDDDSCLGAGAAIYSFDIDPSSTCRDAILHVVHDPCPGRMTSLNGMHVAKL